MIENKGNYYIDHINKEVRWKHGFFGVGINNAKVLNYSYPASYNMNLANESHKNFYKLYEYAFCYTAYQNKTFFACLHLLRRLDKKEILYTKDVHEKYYKIIQQRDYLKLKQK